MVGTDGHGFGGLTGFPFKGSVICPKRHTSNADPVHIGFNLPKAVS
jgi:hypothetical protein